MQISERMFRRLMTAVVALGFVALVAAAAMALHVVDVAQSYTRAVNHSAQVERAVFDLRNQIERLETSRRGYLLQRDPRFRQVHDELVRSLPPTLARITALTIDPAQHRNVLGLRPMMETQIALTGRTFALVDAGRLDLARDGFASDGAVPGVRALRRALERTTAREDVLMARRTTAQRDAGRSLRYVLIAAAVLLVLVGGVSLWLLASYSRGLNEISAVLRRLNEGLEDRVAERTTDLSRANEEIQRFAYIVSHDLRSPLVNVMGFTAELETATRTLGELVDRAEADAPAILSPDAAIAAREDLPEAIGFIRSSTEKMDRLINAILKLSREGRRTLSPQPVDMDALVAGVRDSLRHRLDEAEGDVTIEGTLPPLVSDRLAIEQIVSNLIENAVKYRSPRRPLRITVGGRRQGARVLYDIVDNGRGIDPRDRERIFDLFRRSGAQDQAGEGIGLAHVRALAYRLGGTIACESALDEGATFRLSLPALFKAEDQQP